MHLSTIGLDLAKTSFRFTGRCGQLSHVAQEVAAGAGHRSFFTAAIPCRLGSLRGCAP